MHWLCLYALWAWQAEPGWWVSVEPPVPPLLLRFASDERPRWEAAAEFIYWYPRRGYIPPIVTTGPAESGGRRDAAGVVTLYGDERIDLRHDRLIGIRGQVGVYFDPAGEWLAEVRCFFLERDSSHYAIKPRDDLLLARPYVSAVDGTYQAEIFAGPTPDGMVLEGSLNAYTRLEVFGQEVNLRRELWAGEHVCLTGIIGARFLQLRDRFDVTTSSRELPGRAALRSVSDHFQTFNKFYGGQAGLQSAWQWQPWSLQVRSTLAVGATEEIIRTKAFRLTQTPTFRDLRPLGLWVLPSNSGSFRRLLFDLAGEIDLNLGYQVTSQLRLFVGYTFLGWAKPVRSGQQVDAVNTDQLLVPAAFPARPKITFRDELFWLQGISLGGEVRW
jgi:hypothetical protein